MNRPGTWLRQYPGRHSGRTSSRLGTRHCEAGQAPLASPPAISATTPATFTFEKDCADGGSVAWSGLAQQNEARYSTAINGTLTYRECPSTIVGDSSRCRLVLETKISATGVGIVGQGSIDATTAGRVCGHEVERSFSVERTAS